MSPPLHGTFLPHQCPINQNHSQGCHLRRFPSQWGRQDPSSLQISLVPLFHLNLLPSIVTSSSSSGLPPKIALTLISYQPFISCSSLGTSFSHDAKVKSSLWTASRQPVLLRKKTVRHDFPCSNPAPVNFSRLDGTHITISSISKCAHKAFLQTRGCRQKPSHLNALSSRQ